MNRWIAALKKHEIGPETGCQKCQNSSEGTFGTYGTAASEQNKSFSEPRDEGAGRYYIDWTDEARRDLYEERAAILEYDGGLTRQEAEVIARCEVFGDQSRVM